MLADKLIPGAELRFDRRDWRLLITHDVLLECARLTGLDAFAGEVNLARPSAKLIRALLYLALRRVGAPYTIEEVGARIAPHNIDAIRESLLEAWAVSMPEPDQEKDEEEEASKPARKLTSLDAWATARFDLGLLSEEWLAMTPRQVEALRKRRLEQLQREELLVGIVASTSANYAFCHPKSPLKPDLFMLHPFKVDLEPVTGETLRGVFGAIGKLRSIQ